ncbi:MAG TPA: nucleoside triphosphate pyrophosphohydrolase, partial [Vicinamibacterales bacterium]|nr:nucleoside triphosphate pyrophosphohydrolase [Vicinamibacterales bacterium]
MSLLPGTRFDELVRIMRALRAPGGCPWDREQTLGSLRPFVLEETYELLDALDRNDIGSLQEELGDVLYEAVFLAQIAEEAGHFSIGDAIDGIAKKLVRRHPHVFTPDGVPLAEAAPGLSASEVVTKWEDLKAAERGAEGRVEKSILNGVPKTLPALLRAYETCARAATVGFDWDGPGDVLDKMEEELHELRVAVRDRAAQPAAVEDELGDLLFAFANYARKLGVEPEAALRRAADKFQGRFAAMEHLAEAD